MTDELNLKLMELKKHADDQKLIKLNKRIYNLELNSKFLDKLSEEHKQYVHVKLHNALSYKKPFATLNRIKQAHDNLIKFMPNHHSIDKLDD